MDVFIVGICFFMEFFVFVLVSWAITFLGEEKRTPKQETHIPISWGATTDIEFMDIIPHLEITNFD